MEKGSLAGNGIDDSVFGHRYLILGFLKVAESLCAGVCRPPVDTNELPAAAGFGYFGTGIGCVTG